MILRTSGNIRVELRHRSPGVSGGVWIFRYLGASAPAGTDGWGDGLWLSWEEYDEVTSRVATWRTERTLSGGQISASERGNSQMRGVAPVEQ